MKDDLQYFTVKVANGSGCLFQPLNSEYSYVLTAKHVISDVEEIEIIRQYIKEDGSREDEIIEILESPYLHGDPDKDAAIIKVKKIDGLEGLLRVNLNTTEKENWYLCGHPDSRENNGFSFRKNKLIIVNPVEFYIEAEIEKNVTHSEVIGQSGGGVIKNESSCFLLAGIQKMMAVDDDDETLSRIHFAPLSFFDEIIDDNSDKLSKLYPPYFASLEIILNDIFPLPGLQLTTQKEELLKNQLKRIAKDLSMSFSPQAVLELYTDSILAYGTNKSYISHKQLWIAFLELISINQLQVKDGSLEFDDLLEIRKKHTLVFLDCDDWVKKLDLIVKSDLSSLEKGGAVVVSSTRDTKPTTVELEADYIQDICTVLPEEMTISSAVAKSAEDIKIVHIYKFQKHIIDNYKSFKNVTSGNVKQIMIDETRNVI
ncbi:hypothetical protein FLJC2902T_13150 [Flavobacterium limnosediminis JC2902]|uniref:ABC-three component systems C-terminal domain-containing protein n=1 Tax=Flavobacterium limnosediminis JC2902 TaxID=1341181 RepID=V6SPW7_9FLAO|nr:ABC-three component system protein [Flavobacterium limnosediminis]ESU28723.1 hypothetical protein FLJC2902T_13150 [Flavobacterium limnosediminis JC2902]